MVTNFDDSIGRFTSKTNNKMKRHISLGIERFDITIDQWSILHRLSQQDGINQKCLAEKTDKDQPTLARILDILERKELILRKACKEDRRAFLIYLTEKGIKIKAEIAPVIEEMFKKILFGIPEEHIEIYIKFLSKMNENIYNEEKRVK